jgi:predicted nicotinamide N-methyase
VTSPSPARLRAFVRRTTRLVDVADSGGIRLHVASDVMVLMRQAGDELGQTDPPIPFWGFPWPGGLAVARYLLERPELVAGRTVLDLASGSGLCGIVAMRCGAAEVRAVDVDPLATAATALNARANGVEVLVSGHDPLDREPPAVDVILAGDVCYEETMAERMIDWLAIAAGRGSLVLLGDPGRAYLPPGLELLASYDVRTTREIDDAEVRASSVFTLPRSTAR